MLWESEGGDQWCWLEAVLREEDIMKDEEKSRYSGPCYVRHDAKYIGMQFDGDNAEKIADMLRIKPECCEVWENVNTKVRKLKITSPGCTGAPIDIKQWIILKPSGGSVMVLSDEEMQRDYEEMQ
jgi:hypothetical protein